MDNISLELIVGFVSGIIAIIALILSITLKIGLGKKTRQINDKLDDVIFSQKEAEKNISNLAKIIDNISTSGSELAKKNAKNINAIKTFIDGEFKTWVNNEIDYLRRGNESNTRDFKKLEKNLSDRISELESITFRQDGIEERLNDKLARIMKETEERFLTTYGAGIKKLAESVKNLEDNFNNELKKKVELLKDFIREKRRSGEL
ncbi:MAG: hypothetical protein ACUVWP_09125 [bacterium]